MKINISPIIFRLKRAPVFAYFRKYLIVIIVIIIFLFLVTFLFKNSVQPTVKKTTDQTSVAGPTAVLKLNREFNFPITDSKGKELTKMTYMVESAELRNEIIVKGQKAVAVQGKTFLILTIKLINSYEKPIDIYTRDYVRLQKNGNDKELLAADIHNDPVSTQAISTKYTRIGFPINVSDTKLKLIIGEIKGAKQTIDLNFSK